MTREKCDRRLCSVKTAAAAVAVLAGGCLTISATRAEPSSTDVSEKTAEKNEAVEPSGKARNNPQIQQKDDGVTVVAKANQESSGWAPVTKQSAKENQGVTVIAKGKTGAPTVAGTDSGSSSHANRTVSPNAFRSGPTYENSYDAAEQSNIYGGKSAVDPPRPLLELGREQYTSGIYDESSTFLGKLNPLLPGLAVYGDWRTAVAYNRNNGKDVAQIATRLNLDVDFKFTGTERLHAFFAPIQDNNAKFTRYEFGGGDADNKFNDEYDFEPQTLFFEGDLGSLYSGFSGKESSFDLPFTVGLFPLFLQNGIWANDAILGGAVTLPSQNSPLLGLSNYDITLFAAFDDVDNAGVIAADGKVDNDNANLFGVTTFVDALGGYIEAGYGVVQGNGDQNGLLEHYLTGAYSRRYANTVSNSTRVFANFGENESDGLAIISENSLITGLPSTLLPYANFFIGFGDPKPLVDGNGAGLLKNVGINFETDALTGYPKLDDTGSNAWGGAFGLQYLFNLDQQLVFEVAMVQPFENDGIGAKDPQYGLGARYQVPLDRAWLFRADATYQILEGAEDNFGVRSEVRRKF